MSRVTLAVGLTPPCSLACVCPLVAHGQVASGIAVKLACVAYRRALLCVAQRLQHDDGGAVARVEGSSGHVFHLSVFSRHVAAPGVWDAGNCNCLCYCYCNCFIRLLPRSWRARGWCYAWRENNKNYMPSLCSRRVALLSPNGRWLCAAHAPRAAKTSSTSDLRFQQKGGSGLGALVLDLEHFQLEHENSSGGDEATPGGGG